MTAAVRAFAAGLWMVLRAPLIVIAACVATLAVAVPFAVVLGGELQTALAHQPPIDLAAQEIDAEWWLEYRRHATGLAATFTPAIIGFAAPLENLSALLDRSPRARALAVPVLAYAVVWAFLWGGILHRFDHSGSVGVRFFRAAASRHFRQFLGVSALAGVVTVGLFLTIHPLLFGPVYGWIVTRTDTEPAAFAARVALYIVFGALLAAVSLTADYTRVSLVALTPRSLRDGLAHAGRFIRHQTSSVVVLFLLSVLTFAVALAAYGIADARFGGWRGVLLGQLFVVGRIGLRLVTAAAQLDLYRRSRPRSGA